MQAVALGCGLSSSPDNNLGPASTSRTTTSCIPRGNVERQGRQGSPKPSTYFPRHVRFRQAGSSCSSNISRTQAVVGVDAYLYHICCSSPFFCDAHLYIAPGHGRDAPVKDSVLRCKHIAVLRHRHRVERVPSVEHALRVRVPVPAQKAALLSAFLQQYPGRHTVVISASMQETIHSTATRATEAITTVI